MFLLNSLWSLSHSYVSHTSASFLSSSMLSPSKSFKIFFLIVYIIHITRIVYIFDLLSKDGHRFLIRPTYKDLYWYFQSSLKQRPWLVFIWYNFSWCNGPSIQCIPHISTQLLWNISDHYVNYFSRYLGWTRNSKFIIRIFFFLCKFYHLTNDWLPDFLIHMVPT